ncbi:MAG: fimbrillin family protein [Prevotella sp.]|nr:fimbrillin family protein [Prevotella sp.]
MKTLNQIKQKTLRMLAQMVPAVAALAVLSACSTDDGEGTQQAWNGEIRLVAATTTAGTTRAATDVQATQFDRGQLLSVYLFEAGDESSTFYQNPLTYRVNDAEGTLAAYGVAAPQFPLTNGVDVYALYPSTVKRESTSFSVKTQQADDDSYRASDLMYGTVLDADGNRQSVARSADAAELTFKHMLSKIVVRLEPGTGSPDVNGASVRIQNVRTEIGITSCGLGGLTLGAASGDKQDVVATYSYQYDRDDAKNTGCAAIIVPQTVTGGNFLRLSLKNGTSTTYRLGAPMTFEPGMVYTYTVTVNQGGVAIRTAIEPWDYDTYDQAATAYIGQPEKEVEEDNYVLAVGDIYYADGFTSAAPVDGHGDAIGIVAYLGEETGIDGYTTGLVMALHDTSDDTEWAEYWEDKDDSEGRRWSSFEASYPRPEGTSYWDLPYVSPFNLILTACGGNIAGVNALLVNAGGDTFKDSDYLIYGDGSNRQWVYYFYPSSNSYSSSYEWCEGWNECAYSGYVRLCFAF